MSDYPTVTRIETERGSHIEPPLDPKWSDLEKLRWHASVSALDGGIDVKVHVTSSGSYSVQVGMSSAQGCGFYDAWTYIAAATVGAQAARERVAAAIETDDPYLRSFATADYLTGHAVATKRAAEIARGGDRWFSA